MSGFVTAIVVVLAITVIGGMVAEFLAYTFEDKFDDEDC
jgi:hypothetical protein